jgi:hypothetical protein
MFTIQYNWYYYHAQSKNRLLEVVFEVDTKPHVVVF